MRRGKSEIITDAAEPTAITRTLPETLFVFIIEFVRFAAILEAHVNCTQETAHK